MISTALAPLSPDGLWTARQPVCLTVQAARRVTPLILGGLAPLVLAGGRLLCIDAGNAFDPYAFTVQARRRGLDADAVLDRILVTRAFTIHQLEAVVTGEMPPLLPGAPSLIAVLGLEHLFLEESLPMWERRQVLQRVLTRLARLPEEGEMLLVTHDAPPERGAWWQPLIARIAHWRAVAHEGANDLPHVTIHDSRLTIHEAP